MTRIFLFGTLLDPDLRRIVLGRAAAGQAARLADHAVERAEDGDGPILVARPGQAAEGVLVTLSPEAAARAAFYAAGCGHAADRVAVQSGAATVAATLYRAAATTGDGAGGRDWALAGWQAAAGPLARRTAEAAMAMFQRVPPGEIGFRMPMIRARADARLRAERDLTPADLRSPMGRDTVEVLGHRQPYCHYFAVGETRLRHPLFGGGHSDIVERAGLQMTDAVTVLPYDPVRDRVLMVEQFRYGPWLRGDPRPWVLEPIAGRIDPGEAAEATARREALEEAQVEIGTLHRIGSYYPSPGGVSEYIESFVGIADLPDRAEGLGGLASENEDIRAHVVPFDRARDLLASGEVDTAPLLLSILWLESARNRSALA